MLAPSSSSGNACIHMSSQVGDARKIEAWRDGNEHGQMPCQGAECVESFPCFLRMEEANMDGFIQFFEREIRHYLFPEFFVVEIHGLEAVQMIKQKQREHCSGAESAVRVVEHRNLP